ncbi:MAG: hypothetical protein K0R62_361 [Nonomuraea muscovyensis]|jgi:hypothetical protein|nr:hypothetical protein [Nonomuraea muscovyensis]
MTSRAEEPSCDLLRAELLRMRKKAGDLSFGDIARKNSLGLSKTTVAAVFSGRGRKKQPRWAVVAGIAGVLRAELSATGVDPDTVLGTMEDLHELYLLTTAAP